nr:class I SAM-dependent methyltransferase [Halobacteriovorax sp. HLS]
MNDELDGKLRVITAQTLGHYNGKSKEFWQGTKDHDVTQNIESLLSHIQGDGPFDILDFGCGPGRDIKSFFKLGHRVVGLDGCENFVAMAKELTSCEVLHQNFLSLDLSQESFDGIFANASLFHVPARELTSVLKKLHKSLRPSGILFSSNPRGDREGWSGDRWGNYMEIETYRKYLEDSGFELIHHYYRPEGVPIEQRPWLATLAKKI